jgi:hypothetical protein
MSWAIDLLGLDGGTTTIWGVMIMQVTGSKSLMGSYESLL